MQTCRMFADAASAPFELLLNFLSTFSKFKPAYGQAPHSWYGTDFNLLLDLVIPMFVAFLKIQ